MQYFKSVGYPGGGGGVDYSPPPQFRNLKNIPYLIANVIQNRTKPAMMESRGTKRYRFRQVFVFSRYTFINRDKNGRMVTAIASKTACIIAKHPLFFRYIWINLT